MSGHSKWSTIKRQKGAADAKRGTTFTKLANAISIAARSGGDPTMNFQLRLTIDKAKSANMPKDNIERAIKRGTGELGGARVEEVLYEAYGPGGSALLIHVASDNRNRTSADVKSVLNKFGGKMAESGAVSYQFRQRGLLTIPLNEKSAEEIELVVIDVGGEDFDEQADKLIVYTDPKETESVRKKLSENKIKVNEISLSWEPTMAVTITDEKIAEQILRLMEKLEELDDVTEVYGNFEIPQEIMDKVK